MSPAGAMVLFDIDGTLIRRAGPHHREALVRAVRRVTGLETTLEGVDTSGMLDRDLIRIMMMNAGASRATIQRSMAAVVQTAQSIYVRSCPDLQKNVCPGVRQVLSRLNRRKIPAGLVTGNLTRIAWRKMRRAGIEAYFEFGAFAEMAESRAGLVRLAMQQARKQGRIDRKTRVTLVGDHPNDVGAAKLNGIQSIAVGTGVCPREDLIAASPDLLLPDMRSLKLEMLL